MKFQDFPQETQNAVSEYWNSYIGDDFWLLERRKAFLQKYPQVELENFTMAEFYYIKTHTKRSGKYKYLLTFTLKEKSKQDEAEAYIRSMILKRKDTLGITSFKYSKEHPDSNCHFHSVISTTEPLRKNRFNVYEKKYGFVDIKNIKKGTEEEVDNYIVKEGELKILI